MWKLDAKISMYRTFKMLGYPKPRTYNKTRWWTTNLCSVYYLVVAKPLLELDNHNEYRKAKAPPLLTEEDLKVVFDWASSAKPV